MLAVTGGSSMKPTSRSPDGGPTCTGRSISTARSSTSSRPSVATARRRRHSSGALKFGPTPIEVTTDRAPVYPRVIGELASGARHVREQYANNVIEADHSRLKARLRPMRGFKRTTSARTITAGHAFGQNLRRGHYERTVDLPPHDRVRVALNRTRVLPLTPGPQPLRPDSPPPPGWPRCSTSSRSTIRNASHSPT
jgi:hypothetical protein